MNRQKVVRMDRLKQRIPGWHSHEYHLIAQKMKETRYKIFHDAKRYFCTIYISDLSLTMAFGLYR